ncbi:N-acetylmuramic acid 6-phosphate etherase [Hydrogenispora ethanolica]|uniref:N-acetylmuramic acid 6-phosphate etherase n=1 Tax=Hydrogenispora ethanolica TaxID=1082276 RepID=A0A4R1RC35_HYDET|nr:N-acetylmuramic acid 6-phosphate etherase [Hydrogenispora ethanolica]TCL63299.1 N-acetylmuramic acid 6-phosphate etherase [Hydrogenispora ethanolica]
MEHYLTSLTTESRNERSRHIDAASSRDILRIMNEEDQKVALAVQQALPAVETALEFAYASLRDGGRLIYIGAGTSGRLGVLDAVECPPTFSTDPGQVIGLMAGGANAFVKAVEGAEDQPERGEEDLKAIGLGARDTVVGIAASGRTPYVIGALQYARRIGAKTVALSCNADALISREADCAIEVIVGPEVLTGSTRLKAATAHKMILNMLSTGAMIRLGKAYENLMVDVHVSNYKLRERAIRIIRQVTGRTDEAAREALAAAGNQVKTAIVMLEAGVAADEADERLRRAGGRVREAIAPAGAGSNEG